jgi:MFS family permease
VTVHNPDTDDPTGKLAFPASSRHYVLGLLLVVYVFNFIDRQILNILLEDIKRDLDLSDTGLGFLTGFAFALFYTFAGIPIARWADSGNRRNIIALSLAVWSIATALCGAARSFLHLAMARVAVGIGEAGCSPPAHSLLSDFFSVERRARALGIYSLGITIGSALGLFIGGWASEFLGWRATFLIVGLPGVLLAAVVRLSLREPPRGHADGVVEGAATRREPLRSVLGFLLRLRSFRHLALGAALHAFVSYGSAAFLPVFLIRIHDMGKGEIGTWLGAIVIVGGALGTYLGGDLADRLARRRGQRWYLWLPGVATLLQLPFWTALYLWPDPRVALLIGTPGWITGYMYLGPTFATTQNLVRLRMRAVASAILLFILNLIGLGAGPQVVGFLSDRLQGTYAVESIRYALVSVVVIGCLWSALHYFLGARYLLEDLHAKEAAERETT